MNIVDAGLKFKNGLSRRKNTNRIILHHAAAVNASVEKVHNWHLGNGWSGIGYSFYIRKDGTVYKGRGWEYVGAHCEGYNSNSIGICFEGNYDSMDVQMPDAQYDAGVALIAEALKRYPTVTEICGHKKYGVTACPGRCFPLEKLEAAGKDRTGSIGAPAGTATGSSYNGNVKSLQVALNADGIKDENGKPLVVDGLNGKNTSGAIKRLILKAGEFSFGRYNVGTTGETVRWLQNRLNTVLVCNLDPDGKFGTFTRAAVGKWQKKNNLTLDYVAGADTITSLL